MTVLNFPDSPDNGDHFIATNGVLYTYNTEDDSWTGRTLVRNPSLPTPADVTATPDFVSGSGTSADPYIISPATVALGDSANSEQTLLLSNQLVNEFVRFINNTDPISIRPKFTQPIRLTNANGQWTGVLKYNDAEGITTSTESTYVGTLSLGDVHFSWTITQQV